MPVFFFPVTIFCLPVKLFKKVPVKIRKMAVKILEVKNANENHKKSQKMAKKRARENKKMPVTNFEKVVSRALLGFTGKKTPWLMPFALVFPATLVVFVV